MGQTCSKQRYSERTKKQRPAFATLNLQELLTLSQSGKRFADIFYCGMQFSETCSARRAGHRTSKKGSGVHKTQILDTWIHQNAMDFHHESNGTTSGLWGPTQGPENRVRGSWEYFQHIVWNGPLGHKWNISQRCWEGVLLGVGSRRPTAGLGGQTGPSLHETRARATEIWLTSF